MSGHHPDTPDNMIPVVTAVAVDAPYPLRGSIRPSTFAAPTTSSPHPSSIAPHHHTIGAG